MSRATGVYSIEQRNDDTGRWFTVEEFKPRTSQKTVRWLFFFKAIETIFLDATDDMRVQAVKRAKELYKGTTEYRVQEHRAAESWWGQETVWQNGKWVD